MGRTLVWYDGPVSFEIDKTGLGPFMIAMLVPDRPGWIDTAVAIHLSGRALDLANNQTADMRMLMTRPEASLWRVDFAGGSELAISPILDPLPDEMLPDTGLYLSDFDQE